MSNTFLAHSNDIYLDESCAIKFTSLLYNHKCNNLEKEEVIFTPIKFSYFCKDQTDIQHPQVYEKYSSTRPSFLVITRSESKETLEKEIQKYQKNIFSQSQ